MQHVRDLFVCVWVKLHMQVFAALKVNLILTVMYNVLDGVSRVVWTVATLVNRVCNYSPCYPLRANTDTLLYSPGPHMAPAALTPAHRQRYRGTSLNPVLLSESYINKIPMKRHTLKWLTSKLKRINKSINILFSKLQWNYMSTYYFLICVCGLTATSCSIVCERDCHSRIDLFASLKAREDHLDSIKWYVTPQGNKRQNPALDFSLWYSIPKHLLHKKLKKEYRD